MSARRSHRVLRHLARAHDGLSRGRSRTPPFRSRQAVYNRAQLNSWRPPSWVAPQATPRAGRCTPSGSWSSWAILSDPADRLGMLDGQRMRAARVVLDIGVHLEKPPPRRQLRHLGRPVRLFLDFMRANVNMSDEFVQFEVNRYLGWPGQAPSYKVGQRIWEQLRDDARAADGLGLGRQGVPPPRPRTRQHRDGTLRAAMA